MVRSTEPPDAGRDDETWKSMDEPLTDALPWGPEGFGPLQLLRRQNQR